MKVLQINNSFSKRGGAEAVFLNTISLLREKGVEVIPFSKKGLDSVYEPYQKYFVPSDPSTLFSRFYSKTSKEYLIKLVENEKPDIAHIHNIHGEITFSILPELKKRGIPIVASIHGFKYLCPAWVFINGKGEICEKCKTGKYYNCVLNNCSRSGIFKSFQLAMESYLRDWIFPYSVFFDYFLFVSKFTKEKYIEFNPSIENRSDYLYNFSSNFENQEKGKHKKYFLYLGRLDYEKGISTLISAFKNLPDERLIIAGDGPLRSYVNYNKSDNVDYVGYKTGNEIEKLIKEAFFVIIPSECYENNPMAIVEAYSKGKPVVATNLGGIPEVVENGKTGFLFEAKNQTQLMDVIRNISTLNSEQYEAMCNNAFLYAQNNFNPEKYFNKLISIYKELIQKKK